MTTEAEFMLDKLLNDRMTREAQLQEIVDIDENDNDNTATCLVDLQGDKAGVLRWLLCEVSARDDTTDYYTVWSSIEDAVDYHYDQEYPGDWDVYGMWDLDTGKRVDKMYLEGAAQREREQAIGLHIARFLRHNGRPKGSDIDEWMKEMKG